jgi:hypothetical protein
MVTRDGIFFVGYFTKSSVPALYVVEQYDNSLSLFPDAPTLEQRASVKRVVSLQFLNVRRVGRTPWTGDQPVERPLPT